MGGVDRINPRLLGEFVILRIRIWLAYWLRWVAEGLAPSQAPAPPQPVVVEVRVPTPAPPPQIHWRTRWFPRTVYVPTPVEVSIPLVAAPPNHRAYDTAVELINYWQDKDKSGEFRRHHVYVSLIRKFPHARRRDLALLIEQIIQTR